MTTIFVTSKQAAFDYSKPQTLVVKVEPQPEKHAECEAWLVTINGQEEWLDSQGTCEHILSDYPDCAERELLAPDVSIPGSTGENPEVWDPCVATVTIHNARAGQIADLAGMRVRPVPFYANAEIKRFWTAQHDAPYDPDRWVVVLETRPIE